MGLDHHYLENLPVEFDHQSFLLRFHVIDVFWAYLNIKIVVHRKQTKVQYGFENVLENFSVNPPNYYGIVSFEEGGRIMMDFTDVGEGEIESGKDVKMVFRIKAIDEARGFTRYFWKAVPI